MNKGEKGSCNACKWFKPSVGEKASSIATPFHCSYDGLKIRITDWKCMVSIGDDNKEVYAFEPTIENGKQK